MKNGQYSLEVLVHGKPVKEYQHTIDGMLRTFIEARDGTNYSLRITNHGWEKILAISSVDGLNVVSGDLSDGFKGRGYIIKPYETVVIKGFRESDDTVGSFVFSKKGEAYATEKGNGQNVGVIACNILDEKKPQVIYKTHYNPYPWPYQWVQTTYADIVEGTTTGGVSGFSGRTGSGITFNACCDSTPPDAVKCMAVSPKSKSPNFDLGTKWGERVVDKIIRKHFDKNQIVASFVIYYASKEALEEMGVPMQNEKQVNWPQGFTGDYCERPKGWNG